MRKNTMTRIFGYLAVAEMTLGFAGIIHAGNSAIVTPETFIRAETDLYISRHVKEHPVDTIRHSRKPSNKDEQFVIRENQDVLYSHAVVDISIGATLANPA